MKLALFASGNGGNVMAILKAIDRGQIEAQAVALVCDQAQAPVLSKVQPYSLDILLCPPEAYPSRNAWEQEIIEFLKERQIDLLVLAGFMRILGNDLLQAFPQRILNIHPSLLPLFPGRQGILDAYQAGVNQTGVTIHYLDQGIDTGEIIAQERLTIPKGMTLEELEEEIHRIEHRLYPKVIQEIIKELKGESL